LKKKRQTEQGKKNNEQGKADKRGREGIGGSATRRKKATAKEMPDTHLGFENLLLAVAV